MGHKDELTIEELQEITNEEHQETQRNVTPSVQEEDERRPMPTSAIKDLLKNREMALAETCLPVAVARFKAVKPGVKFLFLSTSKLHRIIQIILPIRQYRLTTVTFGTSSAPFFATRTLRQLAIDEQENYPAASRVILCHLYVDDLLRGSDTRKGAIQLVIELQVMMKRGGFSLRKCVSNDPGLMENISEELKAVDSKHTIKDEQPVTILGIAWLPDVDKFTFTITVSESNVSTKRKVLSEVAKMFDPLDWLSPSIIISKIFLQELWSHHLSWDEELPDSLAKQWRIFREQLPLLANIKIELCILHPLAIDVQVHGFCDS
ncbi:DUF1758 domain-containing protein [Trichonephila clavipes]|nr:DUF1758 domain-containing protein [Trichonephila clavipes]